MIYFSILLTVFTVMLPVLVNKTDPNGQFSQTKLLQKYHKEITVFMQFGSITFAPLSVLFVYLAASGSLSLLGFYTMDYKAARLVNEAILNHYFRNAGYWAIFGTLSAAGMHYWIYRK